MKVLIGTGMLVVAHIYCAFPASADAPGGARRSTQSVEFGISGDGETLALLRQARQWLGSPDRIGAVRTLQIDYVQIRGEGAGNQSTYRYSILFPDRFREDNKTVTTALDGPRYWRQFHRSIPGWQPTAAENLAIRKRAQAEFVETCLTVLLRAPGALTVEAKRAGTRAFGTVQAHAVDFIIKDGGTRQFLFDVTTRQPLGFVRQGETVGAGARTRVEHFIRHERVSGIRVPVISQEIFTGGATEGSTQTIQRKIVIDPPLGAADFREPVKR